MTSPSDRRHPRAGFTLIEAMLAIALLAAVLGGVLAGVSHAVGQTAARTERAWLVELARSVAEEYRVTRDPLILSGQDASGARWRIETRPEMQGLTAVTVIAWRDGGAAEVRLELLAGDLR